MYTLGSTARAELGAGATVNAGALEVIAETLIDFVYGARKRRDPVGNLPVTISSVTVDATNVRRRTRWATVNVADAVSVTATDSTDV